ncbi:MAG: DMT family transporter [Paludibacteraceae bacterium]|nr:DMT family transporter [Paludibacteraceae bacterium]
MRYLGEILALAVAVLWTISSLASEVASKRYGSLLLNIVRMVEASLLIGALLWVVTGSPLPTFATKEVWFWLALSSLAGYIIGDYFFLQCFIMIGARWGELFMTIAPPVAALTGWMMLGEAMSWTALLGMQVTLLGIGMSILSKHDETHKHIHLKLPVRGIVYGVIAGIGQGVGLVFSKQGLLLYREHIEAVASDSSAYLMTMPFAATLIRCLVALVGFVLLFEALKKAGREHHPWSLVFSDHKALACATLSSFVGPFLGVALSLASTMYTSTGITQTLMSLVPVLILWPSHLLFNTKITPLEVVGAIISVAGVALFFL